MKSTQVSTRILLVFGIFAVLSGVRSAQAAEPDYGRLNSLLTGFQEQWRYRLPFSGTVMGDRAQDFVVQEWEGQFTGDPQSSCKVKVALLRSAARDGGDLRLERGFVRVEGKDPRFSPVFDLNPGSRIIASEMNRAKSQLVLNVQEFEPSTVGTGPSGGEPTEMGSFPSTIPHFTKKLFHSLTGNVFADRAKYSLEKEGSHLRLFSSSWDGDPQGASADCSNLTKQWERRVKPEEFRNVIQGKAIAQLEVPVKRDAQNEAQKKVIPAEDTAPAVAPVSPVSGEVQGQSSGAALK